MSVKLSTDRTSFGVSKPKMSYTGSSESTLVKMPHCWKPRVAAAAVYSKVSKSCSTCKHASDCFTPFSQARYENDYNSIFVPAQGISIIIT